VREGPQNNELNLTNRLGMLEPLCRLTRVFYGRWRNSTPFGERQPGMELEPASWHAGAAIGSEQRKQRAWPSASWAWPEPAAVEQRVEPDKPAWHAGAALQVNSGVGRTRRKG